MNLELKFYKAGCVVEGYKLFNTDLNAKREEGGVALYKTIYSAALNLKLSHIETRKQCGW